MYPSASWKWNIRGGFIAKSAPFIVSTILLGKCDLVNSNKKKNWSWFIINQNHDIDEQLIQLDIKFKARTSHANVCNAILCVWSIDDLTTDSKGIQFPLIRLFPEFHTSQNKWFEFDHLLQLTTIQRWIVNFICFKIGFEIPVIDELMLK